MSDYEPREKWKSSTLPFDLANCDLRPKVATPKEKIWKKFEESSRTEKWNEIIIN